MSDDSKELSRVEDILSGEDYLPKKPMSRVEELLMDAGGSHISPLNPYGLSSIVITESAAMLSVELTYMATSTSIQQ